MRLLGSLVMCLLAIAASASAGGSEPGVPRPPRTERVSLASDGSEVPSGFFYGPAAPLSADGGAIAYASSSEALVPGDTNGLIDVFLRDRRAGTVRRISVSSEGTQGNGSSFDPAISDDGRHIAFAGTASNLVPNDRNGTAEPNLAGTGIRYRAGLDVFVHDAETGRTERVSVASDGAEGNWDSRFPSISADARFVAFESNASNLVPGDTNRSVPETLLQQAAVPETGLINDTRGVDIFVHDRLTGQTERVSVATGGRQASLGSFQAAISDDGRYVAFRSASPDLVEGDTNDESDIFVHDRVTDVTERVSVATDETQGNGPAEVPSISADGRFVAFTSRASNLVPNDTNTAGAQTVAGSYQGADVFVRDRATGRTERVSVTRAGTEGNQGSYSGLISDDGRSVVFLSSASNLVDADTNGGTDAFVHDRATGETARVSVGDSGGQSTGSVHSAYPGPTAGTFTFISNAGDLVAGDGNGSNDVFLRDAGPMLGLTELQTAAAAEELEVTGAVAVAGSVISQAADPSGDGAPASGVTGDLVAARFAYRPARAELVATIEASRLPAVRASAPGGGMAPTRSAVAATYGVSFTFGGIRYEALALPSSEAPGDAELELRRCTPTCAKIAPIDGSIGTTGEELRLIIPLAAVAAGEGATLSQAQAFLRDGDGTLDEVVIGHVTIPARSVVITTLRDGEGPAWHEATLEGDRFGVRLPGRAGDSVLGRVCLGATCGPMTRPS